MPLPAIVAVVMMVVSLATTAYSMHAQAQAADEAEKIAERNANRIEQEAEETARRAGKAASRTESLARARMFASGAIGLSQEEYIEGMAETHQEEIDWIIKSGASQADIVRRQGSLAASQAEANIIATAGQGASDAANWYMTYETL